MTRTPRLFALVALLLAAAALANCGESPKPLPTPPPTWTRTPMPTLTRAPTGPATTPAPGVAARPAAPAGAGTADPLEEPASFGAATADPLEEPAATATPTGQAGNQAGDPPGYAAAMLAAFAPLPAVVTPAAYTMTEEMVDLGRLLFYENRISISQGIACSSCHPLDNYGVDGLQFSFGHDRKPVARNSPTVYNAALHIAQFWDGRAADVETQALGPILAAGEMGMPDPGYVIEVLRTIPGYVDRFAATFPADPDPMNYANVGRAIGAFERKLLTPGRWDALLQGDAGALTYEEKAGLVTFVNTGCMVCHAGPALGGNMYARLGALVEYPGLTDTGRFAVTGEDVDLFVFKAPSLRNIAVTGPYLHDGSITSLAETVQLMGRHQLGRELAEGEIASIVTFLNALTGELPADAIAAPELPASGPDTPGPYAAEDDE